VKRLRYAADFFSTCFPREAVRPFLVRLSALQDVLGELNDISVARQLLAEAGFLERRERELIASLASEWDAFERRKPYWKPKPTTRARR
jgi:CHAD domain-containing protein